MNEVGSPRHKTGQDGEVVGHICVIFQKHDKERFARSNSHQPTGANGGLASKTLFFKALVSERRACDRIGKQDFVVDHHLMPNNACMSDA